MSALTAAEARVRAGLLAVESYEVFLDLTADPVRSRSQVRFGCRDPGAATFADLTVGTMVSAVLNGHELGEPEDGRLGLPGLAAGNVLTVEAAAAYSRTGQGLTRFSDPADGAAYVALSCYPSSAPGVFCCFDQPDLTASVAVSVAVPAGWECVANGPVVQRPPDGRAGVWRFAAVPGMRPFEVTVCAGPFVTDMRGAQPVATSVRRRRSLAGADGVAALARFGDLARRAIDRYEQMLGVGCPYPNYDIVFVPDLNALADSVPGLMLVNENLLARMTDPDVLPDGLVLTADLRGRILFTLSARGLASDADLDTLAALDPAQGEQNRAICRAARPDPADKQAAWRLALADDQDWRMAEAHARGLWIPGQEHIMASYRDQYFTQALPALAGREPHIMHSLARLLYPSTLISPATLAAAKTALHTSDLSHQLRVIVREQEAIVRSALNARAAARHPRPAA